MAANKKPAGNSQKARQEVVCRWKETDRWDVVKVLCMHVSLFTFRWFERRKVQITDISFLVHKVKFKACHSNTLFVFLRPNRREHFLPKNTFFKWQFTFILKCFISRKWKVNKQGRFPSHSLMYSSMIYDLYDPSLITLCFIKYRV